MLYQDKSEITCRSVSFPLNSKTKKNGTQCNVFIKEEDDSLCDP